MGWVDIEWAITDDTFTMSRAECNGPPVRPPDRKGSGGTVIDSMAKRALGGEAQLHRAPSRPGWCLTCPVNATEGEQACIEFIEPAEACEALIWLKSSRSSTRQ
jgi:hypothetical protein